MAEPPPAQHMARISVVILRSAFRGQEEPAYQLLVPARLADAVDAVWRELQGRPDRELLPASLIIVNGRNVQLLNADTVLRDGDAIVFVPPVAGGAGRQSNGTFC